MNDLATMARPYCERLSVIGYEVTTYMDQWEGSVPVIQRKDEIDSECHWRIDNEFDMWGFFGPLADEFGIEYVSRRSNIWGGEKIIYDTLLESIMAAVCEAVERQSTTSGGEN